MREYFTLGGCAGPERTALEPSCCEKYFTLGGCDGPESEYFSLGGCDGPERVLSFVTNSIRFSFKRCYLPFYLRGLVVA